MSYITTYTRNHFNPVHPGGGKIDIQDIPIFWTCKFLVFCICKTARFHSGAGLSLHDARIARCALSANAQARAAASGDL